MTENAQKTRSVAFPGDRFKYFEKQTRNMTRKDKRGMAGTGKMITTLVLVIIVIIFAIWLINHYFKGGADSLNKLSATTKIEECRFFTSRLTSPQDTDGDGLGDICDPCLGISATDGGKDDVDLDQDNLPSACDADDTDPENVACKGWVITLEDEDTFLCCTQLFAAGPGGIGSAKTCEQV